MVADAKVDNTTMSLWHHRLSHCSESLIRQMVADGRIPRHQIDLSHSLPFCHSCAATSFRKEGPLSIVVRLVMISPLLLSLGF